MVPSFKKYSRSDLESDWIHWAIRALHDRAVRSDLLRMGHNLWRFLGSVGAGAALLTIGLQKQIERGEGNGADSDDA